MPEIEIIQDGERKKINMKKPKGKHVTKAWSYVTVLQGGGDVDPSLLTEYLTWRDELVAKLADMSVEELNELDIDEKAKLTDVIVHALERDMGFTRP